MTDPISLRKFREDKKLQTMVTELQQLTQILEVTLFKLRKFVKYRIIGDIFGDLKEAQKCARIYLEKYKDEIKKSKR